MSMNIVALRQLARVHGIHTVRRDDRGQRRTASVEAVLATLRSLEVPVAGVADAPAVLRQTRLDRWRRVIEPVILAPPDRSVHTTLRLPVRNAPRRIRGRVTLEDGSARELDFSANDLVLVQTATVEGRPFMAGRLSLKGPWPPGYHNLALEIGDRSCHALVISAPGECFAETPVTAGQWGTITPLYGLHSRRSWGGGDFSDLESLIDWGTGRGARVFGTLPLLASFLDTPFEPSPYRPISRLFWNEFYIDVTAVPELEQCPEAHERLGSEAFRHELDRLKFSTVVDYRRQMALKRQILERLAARFILCDSTRRRAFERYRRARSRLHEYARFRAVMERRASTWRVWPTALRDGVLDPAEIDQNVEHYHLYVQWVAEEQLTAVGERARAQGATLMLDLPLGVHPDGFDAWHDANLFAHDASAGAAPDASHPSGRNWRIPPLHPERSRLERYQYVRTCLRHHMRVAGMLRLDHAMALNRLYWIPPGFAADQGVYVKYPANELHAVLCLESHRHRCGLVGEDLDTVPRGLRSAPERHRILRTHALQSDAGRDPLRPLAEVPPDSVALLNSPDMPPFAVFWVGLDLAARTRPDRKTGERLARELERRNRFRESLKRFLEKHGHVRRGSNDTALANALHGCLDFLAASPAALVLLDPEDLWLEIRPRNIPGSGAEALSWRRKFRYPIETFHTLRRVLDAVQVMDRRRGDRSRRSARIRPA